MQHCDHEYSHSVLCTDWHVNGGIEVGNICVFDCRMDTVITYSDCVEVGKEKGKVFGGEITAQIRGKRGGRGTHGSLTKAGKVRDQVWQDSGLTKTNLPDYWIEKRKNRKKTIPRTQNRRKYLRWLAKQ